MYVCPEKCVVRNESSSFGQNLAAAVCGGRAPGLRAGAARRWCIGCGCSLEVKKCVVLIRMCFFSSRICISLYR